jgi:hypothetical protein
MFFFHAENELCWAAADYGLVAQGSHPCRKTRLDALYPLIPVSALSDKSQILSSIEKLDSTTDPRHPQQKRNTVKIGTEKDKTLLNVHKNTDTNTEAWVCRKAWRYNWGQVGYGYGYGQEYQVLDN